MKKFILALTISLISSSSFALVGLLTHICHSNSKESASIAISLDPDGLAIDWLRDIYENGCLGHSTCLQPISEEVAADIMASDPHDSFTFELLWVN